MRNDYDVIVLGAGIAGLGTALPLARAKRRVLILDRRGLVGQASPAAAGILDPFLEMSAGHPLFHLNREAFRRYPSWITALKKRTGRDVGYRKLGMLYVAFTKLEGKILKDRFDWQRRSGIPVMWKSGASVLKANKFISRRAHSGLFYPTIAKVNPRLLLDALKLEATREGIGFQDYEGEIHILASSQIHGVRAARQIFHAPVVVNAMGSWAGAIRNRGPSSPVQPVRGQIVVLRGGQVRLKTILHSVNGHYIVPWDLETGSKPDEKEYLLGSTMEKAGFKPCTTRQGVQSILKGAERLVPGIDRLKQIRAWAGLRPLAKDHLPILGASKMRGLYYALGYYRSGILIGTYAGELLAQSILTGKKVSSLEPFSPERFE